mmetsp:Transcript_39938/g.94042  ORF Transcript_39938/g.94042 Transcript_39938/m.94042 type:complete len:222 (-) Transcript_39938:338-1003(-)
MAPPAASPVPAVSLEMRTTPNVSQGLSTHVMRSRQRQPQRWAVGDLARRSGGSAVASTGMAQTAASLAPAASLEMTTTPNASLEPTTLAMPSRPPRPRHWVARDHARQLGRSAAASIGMVPLAALLAPDVFLEMRITPSANQMLSMHVMASRLPPKQPPQRLRQQPRLPQRRQPPPQARPQHQQERQQPPPLQPRRPLPQPQQPQQPQLPQQPPPPPPQQQ